MKVIPYNKKNTEFDDVIVEEIRFAIADDNGKIIDDAQGFGYKTSQKANKVMWYRFKGGQQKIEAKEENRKSFFKKHIGLEKFLENIIENNIKEISRQEVTAQDILDEVKKEFGVEIPKEYIFN